MRGPSASEWAGFALSTSIARKRRGWSVRISSGITLHGIIPEMMREPVTGLLRPLPPDPEASGWSEAGE